MGYENGGLNIQARFKINKLSVSQIVRVSASFVDIGLYTIAPPPHPGEMFTNSKNKPMGTIECTSYRCTPEETEIEIIYINISQRIIAGKFTYKNLKNDCGDVINITNGRFDVRY